MDVPMPDPSESIALPSDTADRFTLESNLNFLLRRAHSRADHLFANTMSGVGLTPRQAALLLALLRSPGASISEITRATGLNRGSISEMVPRLVDRGLLVHGPQAGDARALALHPTPAAREAIRRTAQRTPIMHKQLLANLPSEYHHLLQSFLRLLIEEQPRPGPTAAAGRTPQPEPARAASPDHPAPSAAAAPASTRDKDPHT